MGYLGTLLKHIENIQYGELADVTGRYYAMDRDKRWERIKIAYDGLVAGVGETIENAAEVSQVSCSSSSLIAVAFGAWCARTRLLHTGSQGEIQNLNLLANQ